MGRCGVEMGWEWNEFIVSYDTVTCYRDHQGKLEFQEVRELLELMESRDR